MNFQFYLEKLFASENFQKFKSENKDAYPCSCFFIIDEEKNDSKQHFDYYSPSVKQIFSFKLECNCEMIPVEKMDDSIPAEISNNYNFDFNQIEKLIEEKMESEKIKSKIQKILLSLQCKDKKDFLVGTVFISNLGLLKISIDIDEMKITNFEKKSFMDMMKIVKHKK